MAILRVCCCCYSVRRGSYASAVYTIIYFFLFALLTTNYLYHEIYNRKDDELQTLDGASASLTSPTGTVESIQNATNNNNSGVTSTFINSSVHQNSEKSTGDLVIIIVDLTSELCGFAASFLLICGLQQEKKAYLIPWLILVPFHTAIDIISFLNIIIDDVTQAQKENHDLEWWAFVIGLFILLDLTFNLINVYLFLCVFSQYQEYEAGRGTAAYEALVSQSLTVHYHSESGGQGGVATKNSAPKPSINSNERQSDSEIRTNGTGNPCFNDIDKFDIWCEDLVLDKLENTPDRRKASGQLLPKMLNNGQSKNEIRSGSTPSVRFFDGDTKSVSADSSSRQNSDNTDGNSRGNKKKPFGGRLAPIGTRKHSSGNDYGDIGGDSKLGTSLKSSPPSGHFVDEQSDTTTFGTYDFTSEN